ncbi:MAG: hypothetical protein R8G60_13205 [Roseovarius pacificus]|nr:hypothetical protein [Roseovarius pacificus]
MFRSISTPQLASEWAFPSVRGTQKHVSASGVYRILYRLAGRDEKTVRKWRTSDNKARSGGRKSTKPAFRNLMDEAGIPWWSSHDVRRSLTDCMNMQGMPGGSSAVLAHEINQSDFLRGNPSQRERQDFQAARAAEITRAAYRAECTFLPLKKLAMEHWTNAVLDEYERQKAG